MILALAPGLAAGGVPLDDHVGQETLVAVIDAVDDAHGVHEAEPEVGRGQGDEQQGLAAVVVDGLLHAERDLVQRFLPGDAHPARIFVESLLRVGALHGVFQAVRVVQVIHAGGAFAAQVPEAVGVAREAFDEAYDSVLDSGLKPAGRRADAAAGSSPGHGRRGGRGRLEIVLEIRQSSRRSGQPGARRFQPISSRECHGCLLIWSLEILL